MASHVAPSHSATERSFGESASPLAAGWSPRSEADRAAVREQLERILGSPVFSRSQRCHRFLAYVVEQTLEGRAEAVRERSIGVEVFGREPDYDSSTDHVVRSTAGEVRKRLALYYLDPEHEHQIRIDIHPGSYVPEFQLPALGLTPALLLRHAPRRLIPKLRAFRSSLARASSRSLALALAIGLVGILLALNVGSNTAAPATVVDRFWAPILASSAPILVCIGDRQWPTPGEKDPPIIDPMDANRALTVGQVHQIASQLVHVGDAITLSRLIAMIQPSGSPYRVLTRSATAFSDLRRGPAILIGAQNNDWTLRLMQSLRFSFERREESDEVLIRDRQNPSKQEWSVSFSQPYVELTKDYAIVSRVQDLQTEHPIVIVGGIAYWGTLAAGEFLTNPEHLKKLLADAPPDWESGNLQVVLSTDVIGGNSGPPKVLATHFW